MRNKWTNNQINNLIPPSIRPCSLRIIGKGKLLDAATSLASQGITNNQKFLVIVLEDDLKERQDKEGVHRRLQSAKDDALLLMDRDQKYMTVGINYWTTST